MKILIVEDEASIARFVQLELEHEGYATKCVADGREALDEAVNNEYDLIVLDVMLPSLNGIEVLRRLRQVKQTPVIILTARDQIMDKVAGLDLGASPVKSMLAVVVPQLVPGMVSGFIMAFTLSLDDFIVSKFINGGVETIPIYLYNALAKRGADPTLRALSSVLFIAVLTVLIALNVVSARKRKKLAKA